MKFWACLLLLSAAAFSQTMDSGTGAPTSGVGANGDLYRRTDTGWIYGPKTAGAWPSTYSVIIGRGCTTAFHIDWYCTGRGVGGVDPNTSNCFAGSGCPVDPNPLFGVDAGLTGSSPDGTVHTTAQVLAKYTTPDAFYAAVGYTGITHYWAITTTGNDGTCSRQTTVALAVSNACASFGGVGGAPNPGDAIVFRAGSYTTSWAPSTSGTSANPIYVLNYPGEYAKIDSGGGNAFGLNFFSYYTIDGLEIVNSSGSYGGFGYGIDTDHNTGQVIRNNWIHDFGDNVIAGDALVSPLLERNVTNNGGQGDGHDFYLGARQNPATGAIIQDNVIYNGTSTSMQINGRFPSALLTRNIIHDSAGPCLAFYNGSSGATISNNVLYNCTNGAMGWLIYDGSCTTTGVCPFSFTGNIIANNTYVMQNVSLQNTVWYVNDCPIGSCTTDAGYPFSFGSNTYLNNVVLNTNTNTYIPFAFQSGTVTSDVNSTYNNDIIIATGGSGTTTVVQGPSANYTCSTLSTAATVSNCINSNPLLVSMGNAQSSNTIDPHLATGSPGIGAGTPTGAPSIDIQWVTRANPPSIGAYESGGSTTLTIVSPTSLSNAQVGVSYGPVTFMATGGTGTGYTWSVTSSCLPSGLTFSGGGVLSGTPTTNAGSPYSCTYTVTDSGSNMASTTLSLTVLPAVPTLSSISPNNGNQGAAVNVTLTGTALSGGTINSIAGITISGTTTAPTTITATFTISSMAATGSRSVTVTTSGGTSNAVTFTVNAAAAAPNVSFTGKSSPVGKIGIQ